MDSLDHDVFYEVAEELSRVRRKFPHTDACPNGTSNEIWGDFVKVVQELCDRADDEGRLTFAHILREETVEVFAEEDDAKLRVELVQVMAVCTRWIRAIDRRREVTDASQEDSTQANPEDRKEERLKAEHSCNEGGFCPDPETDGSSRRDPGEEI